MSAPVPDERERKREAALQRLAASRLQLRHELIEEPVDDTGQPARKGFNIPRRLRALWRSLRRGVRGSPVAAVAMTALQEWWHGHPWRATSELVAGELHASLRPVVRRHPLAAVLVSGALGLAVMTSKPWRWPAVRRHVQPLPGRLVRWAFHQLGQAPGQALLSTLLVMMARQAPPPPPPTPPEAPAESVEQGRS